MKAANLTKEQLENNNYKFKTFKDACKALNVSDVTYKKYLDKENMVFKSIENKKNDKFTKEWFIENWINTNKSLGELAKEFEVSLSLLESRSSRFGLRKPNKYIFNEKLFFDPTNPNVCYLAGLMATDGYLDINSNRLSICMVGESEKELLESINSYFDSTNYVREYKKGTFTLELAHKDIKKFYKDNFNIPYTNKTFTLKVPDKFFNEDCAKAYVLGCLDGDGCISHFKRGRPTVALTTASEDFVIGLIKIIKFYTGIEPHFRKEKKGYSNLYIGAKNDVKSFLDWAYSTSASLKLERKYKLYLKVKDIV